MERSVNVSLQIAVSKMLCNNLYNMVYKMGMALRQEKLNKFIDLKLKVEQGISIK